MSKFYILYKNCESVIKKIENFIWSFFENDPSKLHLTRNMVSQQIKFLYMYWLNWLHIYILMEKLSTNHCSKLKCAKTLSTSLKTTKRYHDVHSAWFGFISGHMQGSRWDILLRFVRSFLWCQIDFTIHFSHFYQRQRCGYSIAMIWRKQWLCCCWMTVQ